MKIIEEENKDDNKNKKRNKNNDSIIQEDSLIRSQESQELQAKDKKVNS